MIDEINCINDTNKIVHEFYSCIYTNDTERVQHLLNNNAWLKDVLQISWITDMQFYDFNEETRKYKLYFPTIELLDLLGNYGIDISRSLVATIVYSSGIQDNTTYMSSSMQNKNAITLQYENEKKSDEKYHPITFLELAKEYGHSEYEAKYGNSFVYKADDDDTQLTQKEYRDLQTVGKSWFVSRMYHDFIDQNHNNWELTPTGFKMGTFPKITRITQKKYLKNILKSNTIMLSKNEIGLSGAEIKEMAKELLFKKFGIDMEKAALDTAKNTNKTTTFMSQTFPNQENTPKYADKYNDDLQETNSMELTPAEKRNLQTIGKSWFVSRMYHDFIDSNHNNWTRTPTGFKIGTFNRIANNPNTLKKYLYSIMKSNEFRLSKNEIGLSGFEIQKMAKELLDNWDKVSKNPDHIKIF